MKRKGIDILVCIFSILVLTCMLCACESEVSGSASEEEALCSFLQTEKNMNVSAADLSKYILSSNEYDGSTYCIMTDDKEELVYLVRVSEEDSIFTAEKASSDITFAQSETSGPYDETTVFLEGIGFTAGKIYDSSLQPYCHNEPVSLNENNMFAVWFDKTHPEESIIYNKKQ